MKYFAKHTVAGSIRFFALVVERQLSSVAILKYEE
jgi:hypothetical protein